MSIGKVFVLCVSFGAFCLSGLQAALPTPIAWFNMQEVSNGVVADASGNGHGLTLGSTVTVVDDPLVGKALKVTGQKTDWAAFTCPVVTNTTVAFWVKRDAADGAAVGTYPYFLSRDYSGYGINYTKNGGTVGLIDQWDANASGGQLTFSAASVPRQKWHHVVMTVARVLAEDGQSADFTCVVYVDGVASKTSTLTAATVHARSPAGGMVSPVLLNNTKGGDRATSGEFADFRFYRECLTAAEVAELCAQSISPHLVMRYAFDEISETVDANGRHTTPDASGIACAMTLGKNMALVDDGIEGKALRFMGTTEIGGLATLGPTALKERTISAWVRLSSRRTEMNAVSANPYPRFFNSLFGSAQNGGYAQFSASSGYGRDIAFIPAGCGTSSKLGSTTALAEVDTWNHLVLVERLGADGQARGELYVNGKLAVQGTAAYALSVIPGARAFYLGNSAGFTQNRYFCGDMDEFRIYNYAVSADEARRLYSGLARIDAGADFTVAGRKGVLHGVVAPNADDGYRTGYAGELLWTLVSAPVGGEGTSILQPAAAETEVTLPVVGTYVFRLSISDLGVTKSDEVSVTCVEVVDDNAAPTVTVSTSAAAVTRPEAVTLTAAVDDDGLPAPARTRVRWTKTSGPGGVWFKEDGLTAEASFGAAGTYVLTYTADDGQSATTADVTVTVADPADGADLETDLMHYWSLDGQVNPYFKDPIGQRTDFTAPNYSTLRYVPGKAGNGARASAYSGAGSYWSTGASVGEAGKTADASGTSFNGANLPPVNDYLTMSAWVYVDPTDENLLAGNIVGASVVGQGYTLGLRFNEKSAPSSAVNTDGFTLYQQGRSSNSASAGIGMAMVHYPAPVPSARGRWLHVCGILARNQANTALWELWYDGVKQTASRKDGVCLGRVNTNPLLIGGMNTASTGASNGDFNQNWAKPGAAASSDPANFYSRTFPGIVDEVRIWKRKLTPAEIRYLAANPVPGVNRGPSVDAPTSSARHPATRKATQIQTAAFADVLPTGSALTYEWSLLTGDASSVTIGDATAATTTFTATTVGTYVLQLKVSDGERTVYSKPLTLEVTAAGCVIVIK